MKVASTQSNISPILILGGLLIIELAIAILVQLDLLQPLLHRLLRGPDATTHVLSVAHRGPVGTSTIASASDLAAISLDEAPLDTTRELYIEVKESCDEGYGGSCVRARSGPGADFPVVSKLRTGMVLKVASTTVDAEGGLWYRVMFDEWLRYPERVTDVWYVSVQVVEPYYEKPLKEVAVDFATGTKTIIVDRSEQQLYAYDNETLFLKATTSTGLELTPTPRGTFHIFRKIPTRYMQGPLPYLADMQVYDLPGVPWTLYFTAQGAAIHGAYWHNEFGSRHSHGCVNLPPQEAKAIYDWSELGTTVIVRD